MSNKRRWRLRLFECRRITSFSANGEGTNGIFDHGVADHQVAAFTVANEVLPLIQGVVDRFSQCAAFHNFCSVFLKPQLKFVQY